MRRLRYLLNLSIPALAAAGIYVGGPASWAAPVLVFVVVVAAELLLRPDPSPPLQAEGEGGDWLFDAQVLLSLPVQVGIVLLLLWRVSSGALHGVDLAGAIVSAGLGCGGLGINVGHELGHRRSKGHQLAAKILLGTSLYAHFFVEHNRGHHVRVATADDPASARRGEWLYAFWWRSVSEGLRSAFELERVRLERSGHGAWSLRNEVLRLIGAEGLAVAAALVFFGPAATAAWVLAALFGALLLETVNYVEHYGLSRERTERGWAPVRPHHSWNSDHPLGRVLLFELTRHSDHHAHPGRSYPKLRSFPDAPQLPTGYPGMILLALIPPLFLSVMDRRLATLGRS